MKYFTKHKEFILFYMMLTLVLISCSTESSPAVNPTAIVESPSQVDTSSNADADAKAKSDADAKTKADADAKTKADADAKAKSDADAKTKSDADAKAKSDADAKAKSDADAKAKSDADAKAKSDADAKAKSDADAKAKSDADAKAKSDADAKAKSDAGAKAKSDADAKAKSDADAKAKSDVDAKAKSDADAKAKADAGAKAKSDADAKAKSDADANKAVVQMINLSKISDETLQSLIDLSVSKIADRKSNIIAITYDIGASKGLSIPDWPFEQHEVLLSQDQIETTLSTIRSFIENDKCVKDFMSSGQGSQEYIDEEINSFRVLLEKGADATTQRQICATTRVTFNGAPSNQSKADTLHVWVHELYHALQQDIALSPPAIDAWCDEEANAKSKWIVEGGADYFTQHIYAEYIGENGVDRIFKYGLQSFNETGTELGSSARTAATALRLLVERGALKHSDIMDGTLFHKCERVSVYHDNNEDVKIAKSSWSEIQYVYGKYSFNPSVLK